LFPDNCTGHMANYPCGWSSNTEANLYHLKIALDSNNGPNGAPGGYTIDQLKEIWHAANATRSHLIMMWWSPEPLYQRYLGTDAEMQRIMLKPYTLECDLALDEWKDECSPNQTIRVSTPQAACDNPMKPLRKLINAGLQPVLHASDIPEAARSPADDVLRLFQISEVQLEELFSMWSSHETPRHGVCAWAAKNIAVLNATVPPSYPRVTRQRHDNAHVGYSNTTLGYVALTIGILAVLVTVVTAVWVNKKQKMPSIQYAQLDFLGMLLAGSFLVSVGAILSSLPAKDGTCSSVIWFVHVGYTLVLVPLIVKVAAVNRMMSAARSLRRVTIKRSELYKAVGAFSLLIIIYLAVWSALDPPRQTVEYSLSEDVTPSGERIVYTSYFCSVQHEGWPIAAETWTGILLVCASVLAFQTRNTIQTFNESRTLAFFTYSHFVFMVLRMVSYIYIIGCCVRQR
jgi:7 transmembrane sweet-taste receptor of 3 GCPR